MVGQRTAAAMGRGRSAQPLVPGWVVVSAAVAPGPRTSRTPARREWAKRHAQHRAHKRGRKTSPPRATAQRYASTWGLFTTARTVTQAVVE